MVSPRLEARSWPTFGLFTSLTEKTSPPFFFQQCSFWWVWQGQCWTQSRLESKISRGVEVVGLQGRGGGLSTSLDLCALQPLRWEPASFRTRHSPLKYCNYCNCPSRVCQFYSIQVKLDQTFHVPIFTWLIWECLHLTDVLKILFETSFAPHFKTSLAGFSWHEV